MAPRAWCDGTKSAEWLRDGTMRRIKGNEDTQTTNQILHTFLRVAYMDVTTSWRRCLAGGSA